MVSINELELPTEMIEIPDEIPEQFGTFAPPPQPGVFRFKLPNDLSRIWEMEDVNNEEVQRRMGGAKKAIRAAFTAECPLIITQSKDGRYDGEAFDGARIRFALQHRGNQVYVSDAYYLLASGLRHDMTGCKAWGQKDWAAALMKHAGEEFAANIEWSAYCNPNAVRRIMTDDGSSAEDPDQKDGCGANYRQEDIPKNPETGELEWRFLCSDCDVAYLRCRASFRQFRAVSK